MEEVEIWKPVKDFLLYDVSNFGRLRRLEYWVVNKKGKINMHKTKVLRNINSKGDYLRIILRGGGGKRRSCHLHRLVWESFVGEIPKGCIIHHKDGNKQNNRLSNLQLVTTKEHHDIHIKEHPRMITAMNHYNQIAKPKTISQYTLDGKFIADYQNAKEASDATGVCQRNILQVCSKTEFSKGHYRKQAGGYKWKFKDETIRD